MHAIDWLGAVVLRRDGVVLPLSIRKTQALLILLAREGSMPRERIVALLWPALDESTARRNLRRELARLREAGAGEVVLAEGDRLGIAPGVEITPRRFEAELQADRPDDALALWRGPPADGLLLDDAEPWNEWLAQERRRLEALRAQALAQSAARHEAEGAFGPALDRIRALLAADALQEQHHVAAMRLLDRLGQREAALAQYDTCARLLADELGLQPMEATRAMAAALRGSGAAAAAAPSPGPPPPAPVDLLPAQLPFVGREREVAWLERAWRSGKPLLIEGEGGVGKTRLVGDFCAAHGPYAVVPCRAGDAELPLASFTRALRALAGPEPEVQGLPEWVRDELARLMPELGHAPLPLRSEDERLRFGQACTLAWTHWADGNFDAVVIDDWHLADAASQAMWMQVHGSEPTSPRLILVYRPGLGDSAAELLRRQSQGGGTLHLEPLPPDAVFELIRRLSGRPDPKRFAAMLGRATDGNPFYMAETLRHLVDQGLLTAAADGRWRTPFDDSTESYQELPLPASVRTAVLARVARLPDRARRVLEAAALADEPFGAELLAPACALSEVEASLALEEALQARLLREVDEGGLCFVHHLVQQALDAALDAARRRSVHRRLALAAEAAGAAPGMAAAHFEAGGQPARAVAHRLAAGEAAAALYADDEALAHWRQGLADGGTPVQSAELHIAMLGVLHRRDRRSDMAAHVQALMPAWRDGRLDGALRARIFVALVRNLLPQDRAAQGLALLDEVPADIAARVPADLLHLRISVLTNLSRFEDALALGRQAHALPANGQEPLTRFELFCSLTIAAMTLDQVESARPHADAALALARSMRDESVLAKGLMVAGCVALELGRWSEAAAHLREAATRGRRIHYVRLQRMALYNLSLAHSILGEPREALAAADEGLALEDPQAPDDLTTLLRAAQVGAFAACGDLGQALHGLQQAVQAAMVQAEVPGADSLLAAGLEALALSDAIAIVEPLTARPALDPLRPNVQARAEIQLVRAEAALIEGRIDEAEAQLAQVPPASDIRAARVAAHARITAAAVALARGDAAAAQSALPADDAPGMNDELRLRAWTVRLPAQAASCPPDDDLLAQARAQLQRSAGAHALAALQLQRALLQVADTEPHRRACRERVDALASTLQGLPDLRARFEQRWRAVGP